MPFISVCDEVAKKSFTCVENKFITKYLSVLEPNAVKIYLYALYLYQNGMNSYTLEDMARGLNITEDEVKAYFEYLEEFELISITSLSPFEVKILDAENVYGTPKKFKPEKYSDFTKSVQNILKGRMISTNEFREYFYLLEEYAFEQNALLMIITYCVNLKGDNIRVQYIKKVAKSFADEGITSAKKVDEKLSAYTSSTPALIRLFSASGIKKQPDIDDDKMYKKWTVELGFEDEAIISAAKYFKIKSCEKLDEALEELYKNRKFDSKEIEDYCKNKSSVYTLTLEIAKNLGVYMQNPAPYVENYVGIWCNYGFSFESLKKLSTYCFLQGKKSFEDMDGLVRRLYGDGIVADISIDEYIQKESSDNKLLKEILSVCGLTRKVIAWDKDFLEKWRNWNFSDAMLLEAAKFSAGKSNPLAYMNGILSTWKAENIFKPENIKANTVQYKPAQNSSKDLRAEIERHYYDLRHSAEEKAEKALTKATSDPEYGNIRRQINELSIKLAFAGINDEISETELSKQIKRLEEFGDRRLAELKIDKSDFTPKYSCRLCKDTGYDNAGNPCECMKRFIEKYNR